MALAEADSLLGQAVAFSTFASYTLITGEPLTSEIVFPAITLFSLLGFPLAVRAPSLPLHARTDPSISQVLPVVFSSLVEAYVSIDRLTDFLCGKELQSGATSIELPQRDTMQGDELISVAHGEFAWNSKPGVERTLVDINLSVKKGELLAVVGRVGAGKSSLLSAVLGEMTKMDGRVTVRGTVAYCGQQPWIMGECLLLE